MHELTTNVIRSIDQDGLKMPKGPILHSADRCVRAGTRELITKKTYHLKMPLLTEVKELFGPDPFFAGFGNRDNDTVSYMQVGVPLERIWCVNKKGEVHRFQAKSMEGYSGTTSYKSLATLQAVGI